MKIYLILSSLLLASAVNAQGNSIYTKVATPKNNDLSGWAMLIKYNDAINERLDTEGNTTDNRDHLDFFRNWN